MKWLDRLLMLAVVLILLAVLVVVAQGQPVGGLFHVSSPIVIHAEPRLDADFVREALAGESLLITAPYVQSDDLVWVEVATGGWAAVARYGDCTIFSWGEYEPDWIEPVSASPLGQ